jgi:hypothetical protein
MRVRRLAFDGPETGTPRRLEAVEERIFLEHQLNVGGETRHGRNLHKILGEGYAAINDVEARAGLSSTVSLSPHGEEHRVAMRLEP